MAEAEVLHGVRVLDLSGEAGQFCGKLLGDFGADVIKIDPPAGAPVRQLGTFYADFVDVDRSLYWHAMNTSKRTMTSITPLGQTGPYCHPRATELELLALGGPGRLRRSGAPATLGRSLAEMTRLQDTGVVA